MDKMKKYFRKMYTNRYSAVEIRNGKEVPRLYRRNDLCEFAKEAFNKGERYFYANPVNPDKPYGELRLSEPEYKYILAHPLSEEEFIDLCEKECTSEIEDYIDELDKYMLEHF